MRATLPLALVAGLGIAPDSTAAGGPEVVLLSSLAVEAAIVESASRFKLNSRALLQLADAGVSPNVIDLMVAQSFPSHFRVERPASAP